MRKLLFAAVLLLMPMLASAGQADRLLTPDGTLFTVDVQIVGDPTEVSVVDTNLVLSSRRGTEISTETVPASLSAGEHADAAIAYDVNTGTLFLFWLHRQSLSGSELLFASRSADGVWSEPTEFSGRVFDSRQNLRIAVTRKYLDEESGETRTGISVHATWWEWDTHEGEWFAQYQLITVVNGVVAEMPSELDLRKLARRSILLAQEDSSSIPDVMRHPMLFPSATQDTVVLLYGDSKTRRMHELQIQPMKPASQGRLRVPVGRSIGNAPVPSLSVASNARVDGIYGAAGRLALYTIDGNLVRFVSMKDGGWDETKSVSLDENLSAGVAIDALRRLVTDR